ncbi:IS3 family transposase, partial [Brucella abortus]|nr:IS3-like element IS1953 family transposase [Brucella abortus]AAL59362.1 putative transposase [Brucella abortus]MBI1633752.1 IS3 family transposase [Brucella abortus]MBI1645444.1 IS3 family transposase [Brucella abortus]MBI1654290.1 IS3 family transposase [Brucella abortus]MBI1661890.1 IS3 family transposase [Brucella abortus]
MTGDLELKQREFTEDFKREAVRILTTSGRNISSVAEDLGIGKSTLERWRRNFAEKDLLSGPHEDMDQELARLRKENELLRQERDLLKKSDGLLRSGDKSMKFAFIDTEKAHMSLSRLCAFAGVSISGYYAWKHRLPSRRQLDDMIILAHIRNQFALSRETYGSPRMHVELNEEGIRAGRHRTARLMRENGLKARQKTRFKRTTDSNHGEPVAPNLLDQDFTCDRPDQKWGVDISYIWTAEGWLYLAIVVDLYSRRIIGWEARDRMKKDLAICALKKAIAIRYPKPGLIQHSDRGSQYASYEYRKILKSHSMLPSMSGKGNCYDNAMVETVFKTIKSELIWRAAFQTRNDAIKAIGKYIDGFYNPVRRHSTLGYKSPVKFEAMNRNLETEALH